VKTWIGIDVSKDQLDVCLLKDNGKEQARQFRNDPAGHEKLLRWVRSQDLVSSHFCMEHTGGYSMGIALFLADNDLLVSVENPTRIKSFRTAKGTTNKTDKADARTIAHYCRQMEPEPWRASAPEVRQLCALMPLRRSAAPASAGEDPAEDARPCARSGPFHRRDDRVSEPADR
jgi:transposase